MNRKEEECVKSLDTTNKKCGYNNTKGGKGVRGYKYNEEQRKARSLRMVGENNPWYGKKLPKEMVSKRLESMKDYRPTEETKRKISESKKGKKKSEETKAKMSDYQRNKEPPSLETREKMSVSGKIKIFKDSHKKNISDAARGEKRKKNSSSKYVGVTLDRSRNKWLSGIIINGKRKNLGRFENEIDAALAYNNFAISYFGEGAKINII